MWTSLTISVPLIPTGESSQKAIIFTLELTRGQVLSPAFMNVSIITGLVYDAHKCRAHVRTKTKVG